MLDRLKNTLLALSGESVALLHDLTRDSSFWHDALNRKIDLVLARLVPPPPAPPRLCTVLLLWEAPPIPAFENELGHVDHKPGWPGFASVTVAVPPGFQSAHAKLLVQYHVPAGAWVVGLNCYLRTVLVGHDLMDLGMPAQAPICRLHKGIQVGQYLQASVVPCG